MSLRAKTKAFLAVHFLTRTLTHTHIDAHAQTLSHARLVRPCTLIPRTYTYMYTYTHAYTPKYTPKHTHEHNCVHTHAMRAISSLFP